MTYTEKRDIIDKIELIESMLKTIRDKVNKEIVEYETPTMTATVIGTPDPNKIYTCLSPGDNRIQISE